MRKQVDTYITKDMIGSAVSSARMNLHSSLWTGVLPRVILTLANSIDGRATSLTLQFALLKEREMTHQNGKLKYIALNMTYERTYRSQIVVKLVTGWASLGHDADLIIELLSKFKRASIAKRL